MILGDIVPSQTMTGAGPQRTLVTVPGRVVYIHPERHFYTLAYDLPGGTIKESYSFKYRRGETSNENNINCQPKGRRR